MSYYTPLWECHFDVNVYPRSQAPPQETAREPGRSDHMPCDVLCVVLITELLPMQSVLSIISSIQVLLELWTLLTQIGTRRLVRCYLAGKLPISSSRLPPHFSREGANFGKFSCIRSFMLKIAAKSFQIQRFLQNCKELQQIIYAENCSPSVYIGEGLV